MTYAKNTTTEERIKREYAPVIGDYGWLVGVQKDATGRLVMKCPATVKLVEGGRVLLEHENGKTLGWTNLRIEKSEDGYSDFFYNLSGYWRCAVVDCATIDEMEVAFPGVKYGAETETSASINPEETYDRQAETRMRAFLQRQKEVFETRYECQAVRFDEVTRNRTMFKRETANGRVMLHKDEPFVRLE